MGLDVGDLATTIDVELRAAGSPERAAHERAYLKSSLQHYGTSVPSIRKVARSVHRRHPELTHDQVVELAVALWAQPVHERRMVCAELLDLFIDVLGAEDVALVERLIRESLTWALVDNFAPRVMGQLIDRDPALSVVLDRWAVDPDFWIRRSALLALLIPLRRGGGDFERFSRYADAMLDERQFFIRKAIGWVLRDTGRKRPELVFDWSLPRAPRMSGVTLREVLKVMSDDQRAALLAGR